MMYKDHKVEDMTLEQMNAALNCLASKKCRAKDVKAREEAEKLYGQIADIKAKKFGRKKYADYTQAEVKKLDIKTLEKGLASLRSKRSRHTGNKQIVEELLKKEAMWLDALVDAKNQELLKKLQEMYM